MLATIPFLSLYLAHYLAPRGPTGFIQKDQPYYCANGREVFERGNGFAHPNPYDPAPDAPTIYFHWITWLLGFGVKKLALDPGVAYVAVGVLGGLACSWFTLRLVEAVLPDRRLSVPLFFLAMWGGGIACITRVAVNLLEGLPVGEDLLDFDPAHGWWFQCWGRNLLFAPEAVYHALVAFVWLALVRDRRWSAVAGTVLLAATHPFSGLQVLLMVLAWFSLLAFQERSGRAALPWLVIAATLGLFLWYYMVFLESFPHHRELRHVWIIDWTISVPTLLLAIGPVGCLAVKRVSQDGTRDRRVWLFGTCFLVSFALAKHDWFVKPVQPLHFTRGYLWLPLYLIALPWIQRFLVARLARGVRFSSVLALSVFGVIALSDNTVFLVENWQSSEAAEPLHLSPHEREMLRWVDRQGLDGVLLCSHPDLSYLSGTYTSARPYLGHIYNTPRYLERRSQTAEWLAGKDVVLFNPVDYVLVRRAELPSLRALPGWRCLHENEELVLLGRPRSMP